MKGLILLVVTIGAALVELFTNGLETKDTHLHRLSDDEQSTRLSELVVPDDAEAVIDESHTWWQDDADEALATEDAAAAGEVVVIASQDHAYGQVAEPGEVAGIDSLAVVSDLVASPSRRSSG
ncbi:hypothetical protein F444_05974 [Phytophthora nicotianae P1976]|uniref:RxLR effector protein n=1 Tax=Phytophthora nicotianae P1976 TaxID=1317066 RepID=A0A081AK96_PHYNI|nr:hypothetical protein F444_05974 [Phytophthora nicotianae P1976]